MEGPSYDKRAGQSFLSRDQEQGDEPDRGNHRLIAVPIDALTDYRFVVVSFLARSVDWRHWGHRMRSATIYRVLAALLVLIAAVVARSIRSA